MVTSGDFTGDATKFARENNIQMIDGNLLKKILAPKEVGAAKRSSTVVSKEDDKPGVKANPVCPKCGGPLVKRTAKKGSRAGQDFWGCSAFPKCRFTKPI
ncbi:topoisomerase DNA-binding C4 zinc finger domain-containing protein [Desulfobulbus marinus]|nr:topoisomerase DNA-binding C4 zinc finger domain-containing protein [Desulfogranum marinum]